jgi:hypothetical protein
VESHSIDLRSFAVSRATFASTSCIQLPCIAWLASDFGHRLQLTPCHLLLPSVSPAGLSAVSHPQVCQATSSSHRPCQPDAIKEAEVVLRAVCMTKLPTLTFEDVDRFRALISDVLPGVTMSDATNVDLEVALKAAAAEASLQLTEQQVKQDRVLSRCTSPWLSVS